MGRTFASSRWSASIPPKHRRVYRFSLVPKLPLKLLQQAPATSLDLVHCCFAGSASTSSYKTDKTGRSIHPLALQRDNKLDNDPKIVEYDVCPAPGKVAATVYYFGF